MIVAHLLISTILALIAGFITYAFGVESPWPVLVGVIVFAAYWGVSIVIIDGDIF